MFNHFCCHFCKLREYHVICTLILTLKLLWKFTIVCGPCAGQDRQDFIDWFNNTQIGDVENWLFIGDFNFYRSLQDKNREGGNMQDIFIFNEVISNLGLQEIPLKGRNYTWTNIQQDPLLEQIDSCFTALNWISDYPNTLMLHLSRPTSDHTTCMVQIQTSIQRLKSFGFKISGLINQWFNLFGSLKFKPPIVQLG
jgi:hypothetical protein